MTRKYLLSAFVGFVAVGCGDDAVGQDTDTETEGTTNDTTTTGTMSATQPTTTVSTTETTTVDTEDSSSSGEPTTDPDSSSSGDPTTGPPPPPVDFLIRIENISDQTPWPTTFTPGVWVEHELGSQPVFQLNMAETGNGLAELAEDGDPTALNTAMDDDPMVAQHGIFDTPVKGKGPEIGPGEAYEFTIEQIAAGNRLSVFTAVGEANDMFLGTGPNGVGLFAPNGEPQDEDDIAPVMDFYDVGSEANQPPSGGDYQIARQAAADTGPDEAGVVSARRESTHAVPLANKMVTVNVVADAMLGTFTVEITNITDESGGLASPFSEAVFVLGDDTTSIFALGDDAGDTAGLEGLVEDNETTALVATLTALGGAGDAGETDTNADPGDTMSFTVVPDATNRFLHFAAGVSWTNDAFISTSVPIALFDDLGVARTTAAIESDFVDLLAVFDAGTEVNESTGISGPSNAANQVVIGTGTTENNPIAYYLDTTNDFADLADFITVTFETTGADSFDMTITNTSEGTPFEGTLEGVVWAMHDGYSGFTEGMAASPDLEDLAEDGVGTGLDGDIEDGGFTNHDVVGPIAPGDSVVVSITSDSAEPMLSLFAHVQPSNDTFVAFGPDGFSAYNGGTLLSSEQLDTAAAAALDIYDAGTEGNQSGGGGAAMSGVGVGSVVGPVEGNGLVRQAENDPVWGYPEPSSMVRVIVTPLR
jgi:hypothetical protein